MKPNTIKMNSRFIPSGKLPQSALALAAIIMLGGSATLAKADDSASSTLKYNQPAILKSIDREALPIGNGPVYYRGKLSSQTIPANGKLVFKP